jgi:Protein of unknown function (DUF4058)
MTRRFPGVDPFLEDPAFWRDFHERFVIYCSDTISGLLLGGKRMPMRRPLPPGECFAIVSRYHTRPDAEVYAWSLRDVLPAIRLPLRAPDADLVLDLSAIYEETFRRGRYERELRYDRPLQVPLPPAAGEWIADRANKIAD